MLNATSFLRNLLAWEGFQVASGLDVGGTLTFREEVVQQLVSQLENTVGGRWLVAVAFGLYSHGPFVEEDGTVVALDLSRLRVMDARTAKLVQTVVQLRQDILSRHELQAEADDFSKLIDEYRSHLGTEDALALLDNMDNVVSATIGRESNDEHIDDVMMEVEKIQEEVGSEAVIEFLDGLIDDDEHLRARYIDALADTEKWPDIITVVRDVGQSDLCRSELEYAIFAYAKTGDFDAANKLMTHHLERFDDNGAKIFRREMCRLHAGLDQTAPGEKS